MRAILLLVMVGCGTEPFGDDAPSIDYGDPEDDPQLPPRGMDAVEPWLATGHHQSWKCESIARPAMPGSPHGSARVCTNTVLANASDPNDLPVGSATVKEIYAAGGTLLGHAVSRKVADEGGPGWYWYEFHSNRLFVDGMNTGSCPGCHASAVNEYTFVVVR